MMSSEMWRYQIGPIMDMLNDISKRLGVKSPMSGRHLLMDTFVVWLDDVVCELEKREKALDVEPTHHVKFTEEEVVYKEHIDNVFVKLPKQECDRNLCALWNGEYTYANGRKIKRGEFCARCKRDRWQQSGDRPDLFRSV